MFLINTTQIGTYRIDSTLAIVFRTRIWFRKTTNKEEKHTRKINKRN